MMLATLLVVMSRGILFALALILVLFLAIRRDPKDRVLLFQTLAFVSFIVAGVVVHFAEISGSTAFLSFIPFIGFAFLAAYFAVTNWLQRRKKIT